MPAGQRGGGSRPAWDEAERTHYQLYNTVSEGTPLSDPCESPEALARWLVENREYNHKKYPDLYPARTYEQWMKFIGVGWAMSGMFTAERGYEDGITAVVNTPRPRGP